MYDINKALMNPLTLAGLGVASGKDLSQALTEAAATSNAYKQQQQQQAEYEKQQQLQMQLPSLLNQIDINNPNQALSSLVSAGVPFNQAAAYVNQAQDNARAQKTQQALSNIFGEGGGTADGADPDALMKAAVLSGNPQLMQAATFRQQQLNRQKDAEKDKEKIREQRQYEKESKPKSPEAASKIQLVKTASKNIGDVEKIVFNKDGSLNKSAIFQGEIPIPFADNPNLNQTQEARQVRALMKNAINAQLRAESGAAVPEEEVKRGMDRFMPSVMDSPETARLKINNLKELLQGTLELSGKSGESIPDGGNIDNIPQDSEQSVSYEEYFR